MSQLIRRTVDCTGHGLRLLPSNLTTGLQMLIFASNRLDEDHIVDLDQLVNMTELDLSSNHLYSLSGFCRPLPQLKHLALMNNQLDYVDNRTFWTMPNLEYLSLSGNKIEIMHANAFSDMRNLHTLDLSSNQIYTLDSKWFRDLVSARRLILSNNNLHTLRDSGFSFLRDLRQLDLSRNQINHVYKGAFLGLPHLEDLSLYSNHLKSVPREALLQLRQISLLDLGQNHMTRILPGDFENSSVAILKLNDMLLLRMIERKAFHNLPALVRLEMSNCHRLQYIDRSSFHALPKLHSLFLHHNNLSTLEGEIALSLPSLSSLSIGDNPFVCDCVANWLFTKSAGHNITLEDAASAACSSPPERKGALFSDPSLLSTNDNCPPRLIGLFDRTYDPVLGDTLRLDCRAVGIPTPQTDWLLPAPYATDGVRVVKARAMSPMTDHREVEETGSLVIHYVQGIDHGDYTCLASNTRGRSERKTTIRVKNMRANVIIMHVTSSEVTMTWKSIRYDHEYQILYRAAKPRNTTYQTIDIKPYMRTYTASELRPSSTYEVCIAVKHKQLSIRINCTSVVTKGDAVSPIGVLSLRRYVIGGVIGLLIVTLCAACAITYLVKKYNQRRKAQEEIFSDNLSHLFLASMDSMSDITPITFENRAAEIFDDDDLEEIRSTASMAPISSMRC
ncbi:hypothetical protein CAPTEDRAFT_152802 [Capitella teleta]|uniref:Ig-like domain-containing protein n=1 Tax=Capitella teleta TaxID=283909 RepID=R7V445_CAPTE|nr:hypothetical protein CAPTEDRAFT_152802 [Capitella teleta]|eukprot:ELU10575.1 hypothetical protein CAPTEDRAFT_152802 [Capitella teleta]